MRFYQDKAYNVVMNILKKQVNFRKLTLGLLYDMLNLKEESSYNDNNIYKAITESKWKSFLEDLEKAKIEKYKVRKSTHETYTKWATPLAALYFIDILLHKNLDLKATFIELAEISVKAIENINNNKIKKLNQFLKESGLNKITLLEIEKTRIKLDDYIKQGELPF